MVNLKSAARFGQMFGILVVCLSIADAAQESFVIISDIHVDPTLYDPQESCRTPLSPAQAADVPYGSYDCEPTWALVESAIQAMAGLNPTFVVWLGDNTHHAADYSNSVFTQEGFVVEVVANVTRLIQAAFPTTTVIPVIGNHDYLPKNKLPPGLTAAGTPDPIYAGIGDLWATWIGSQVEVDRFKASGYYTRMIDPTKKLRAVVLNSNLYLFKNTATEGLSDPGDQHAWLNETLSQADTAGEKVFLIMHVPIGYSGMDRDSTFIRAADNQRLVDSIRHYSHIILGVFSAHSHTDAFRVIYNDDNLPVSTVFIAPSISQRVRGWGPHNPGIRQVTYTENQGQWSLDDLTQYYINLMEANANPGREPSWRKAYNFQSAYSVPSINPDQTHQILVNMRELGGARFHAYQTFNKAAVGIPTNEYRECDCSCRITHVCAIGNVLADTYEQCISDMDAACAEVSTGVQFGVSMVLIISLLFCNFVANQHA